MQRYNRHSRANHPVVVVALVRVNWLLAPDLDNGDPTWAGGGLHLRGQRGRRDGHDVASAGRPVGCAHQGVLNGPGISHTHA